MFLKNYFFFIIIVLSISSCLSRPEYRYVEEYQNVHEGFDINIEISNITEDEYNYFIDQMKNKNYTILENKLSNNVAHLKINVTNLNHLSKLQSDINNLKVVYSDSEEMENMFEFKAFYKQYVFAKDISVGSGAKYSVKVIFSPNSSVNIGGYNTYTNKDGIATFNGIGLNLDKAIDGIIYIIDSRDNKVQANLFEDGKWYIKAVGVNLGKSEEQLIELEAFK